MTRKAVHGATADITAGWSVVVVYEDDSYRKRAVDFCDQFVERIWANRELDVSWWSFDTLADGSSASTAAQKAANADLVIFSAAPEGDLPLGIMAWIQSWLRQRGDREGKLVGLLEVVGQTGRPEGQRHLYLRTAAHRCAMDYLTELPQDISLSIPESFESYNSRACEVTSLLDGILHQQPPPPTPLP